MSREWYSSSTGVSESPYILERHSSLQTGPRYKTKDNRKEVWLENDYDGSHLNCKQDEYIRHYRRYDTEIELKSTVAKDQAAEYRKQMVKEFVENDCLCDVVVRELLSCKAEKLLESFY